MAASRGPTVAIAVIGVGGSGKSTFINLASGSNLPVRKSAGSCTTEIESATFTLDGQTVTLIDTPGFDGTTSSVLDVLKSISSYYYFRLYSQGAKLAGVLYMHCVAGDRFGGPSRNNFRTFCKFRGDTTLRDLVIVTNGGSGETCDDGDAREQESAHSDDCFQSAVEKGARMIFHDGSQASAHAILRQLIHHGSMNPLAQGDPPHQGAEPARPTTCTSTVRELSDQVEQRTKTLGEQINAAKEDETKEVLREEAGNSLEEMERIRQDLEREMANIGRENTRLEDENRQYKDAFSAQRKETERDARPLEEQCKARELAEAEKGRMEAQLAAERALWEREKMKESLGADARNKYGKYVVCGAVIFALVCASRFVFDGSITIT